VKVRLGVLAAVLAVTLAFAAQSSARQLTTGPPPVVTVKVTITDSAIRMSPKRGQRGAFGRFILLNRGSKPHTFTLGTGNAGRGAQTGFTKALRPGEQSILLLFLDFRGTLPYAGTLPADRSKPGMKGTFTIF
jgi:hypothetical protein